MPNTMASIAPPKTVGFQSPATTPTQAPSKRPVMITQGQKQALIDNLQLEITERARKLRAQYALQAQSLRARIEMRVNRIPTAMRKANVGELYAKYLKSIESQSSENEKESSPKTVKFQKQPSPTKPTPSSPTKYAEAAPAPSRGTKRPSDHFSADDDKENTPDPTIPLYSKKRPKPNTHHPANPSTVLSPKSSNSRALAPHQSPTRLQLGSPQKTFPSHPTSPLKPSITVPVASKPASPAKAAAVAAATSLINAAPAATASEKPRATRTRGAAATKTAKTTTAASKAKPPITRAKRGAGPPPAASAPKDESRTVSAASNTSTATTLVTRPAAEPATKSAAAATRKRGRPVAKKAPVADVLVEAPAQGRRVLRKRG
ncbi:MAG: hypothetical protein L6R40_005941 [Gallowayella cf. fulva]|nr:MAG: hypothetical protein L6R40_005941 [Xanthomendoza cf. fulva]